MYCVRNVILVARRLHVPKPPESDTQKRIARSLRPQVMTTNVPRISEKNNLEYLLISSWLLHGHLLLNGNAGGQGEENERNREPRDDDATASTKNCDTVPGTTCILGVRYRNKERGREGYDCIRYCIPLYCYIFYEYKNFRRDVHVENSTVHRIDVQTVV
jgi:hypothetical protein